jgi:hypothetical protein
MIESSPPLTMLLSRHTRRREPEPKRTLKRWGGAKHPLRLPKSCYNRAQGRPNRSHEVIECGGGISIALLGPALAWPLTGRAQQAERVRP